MLLQLCYCLLVAAEYSTVAHIMHALMDWLNDELDEGLPHLHNRSFVAYPDTDSGYHHIRGSGDHLVAVPE